MALACYATLCFPDALLHGSDLLHWQTLRCLSGLGLFHPENSVVCRFRGKSQRVIEASPEKSGEASAALWDFPLSSRASNP